MKNIEKIVKNNRFKLNDYDDDFVKSKKKLNKTKRTNKKMLSDTEFDGK